VHQRAPTRRSLEVLGGLGLFGIQRFGLFTAFSNFFFGKSFLINNTNLQFQFGNETIPQNLNTILMSVLNLVTSLLVVLKFYDVTNVADDQDNPSMKIVSLLQGFVNLLATIAFLSYFVRASLWTTFQDVREAIAKKNSERERNRGDENGDNEDEDGNVMMNFVMTGRGSSRNNNANFQENLLRDEQVLDIIADVLVQPRAAALNEEEIEIDLDLEALESKVKKDAELEELERLMNQLDDDAPQTHEQGRNGDDDDEADEYFDFLNQAMGSKRNQELEDRRLEMERLLKQKQKFAEI
jgi:hypothetical protein